MTTFLISQISMMLLFASFPGAGVMGATDAELSTGTSGKASPRSVGARSVLDPNRGARFSGGTVVRSFQAIGWDLVRLPEGMSSSEGLARYGSHPEVAAAEPNSPLNFAPPPPPNSETSKAILHAAATPDTVIPNDPRWSQWNVRKIGMPAAWTVTTGSSNVVVAVLDTGVDYTHEDLRDNIWRNPGESGLDATGKDKATNGIDDDANGYVDDVYGIDTIDNDSDPMDGGYLPAVGQTEVFYHGSACTGIVAARGNNGRGMVGIAWDVAGDPPACGSFAPIALKARP